MNDESGINVKQDEQPSKSRYELYVDGLMNGKSRFRAALDAGFCKGDATNPTERIEGRLTQELMNRALAPKPAGTPHKSRYEFYVEGLLDGKRKMQAARDAGFPESKVRNPGRTIEGRLTRELIRKTLENAEITLDITAQRIREGLDAVRPLVVPGSRCKEPTVEVMVDFETRLRYVQHIHKLLGIPEHEEQEVPEMRVNVVAVGGGIAEQRLLENILAKKGGASTFDASSYPPRSKPQSYAEMALEFGLDEHGNSKKTQTIKDANPTRDNDIRRS